MFRKVKAGMVQVAVGEAATKPFDQMRGIMLEKHISFIDRAAGEGVKIICLQELFTCPYFAAEKDRRWLGIAEPIPGGQTTKAMMDAAKRHDMVIIAPFFEKDGDAYYNSAAVIDAGGSFLGKYRKTHIPNFPPCFWEGFYFKPGDLGFPVFDTKFGKVGVLICYDRHFPEAMRMLALNGAEIVFTPTAGISSLSEYIWKIEPPAMAAMNQIFVGAVNRVGREPLSGDDTFYGQSHFATPRGEVLAMGSRDGDELITADLDFSLIDEARKKWPFFRDRRPDIYAGLVEEGG